MSDRGDHGSFADEERLSDHGQAPSDSGADSQRTVVPNQINPSYDLFGNPLLPAKPEPARANSSAVQAAPSKEGGSGQTEKPSVSTIIYIVAGLCVLFVAAFFADKAWNASRHPALSTAASDRSEPASRTTSDTTLTANEIFKNCAPSIVTLTIVTKALQVKGDEFDITSLNGEDPVLAVIEDGTPVLYDKGKPAKIVAGMINTGKGKLLVGIRLIGTQPVLMLVSEKGDPILRGGKPVVISKGLRLANYVSEAIGSGFYVRPDIVATNCHVVSDGPIGPAGFAGGLAQITDKPGKFTITDRPIAVDRDHDLALLYVPGTEAKPMTLRSDYSGLKVGESVFALGSPKGLAGSLSEGLISSDKLRGKNPRDPDSPKMYLQHSAKIDHGNSGGPLVDSQGRVIGINTAGMGNGAINLAVVVHFVDDLLNEPAVKAKVDELAKQGQTDLHG